MAETVTHLFGVDGCKTGWASVHGKSLGDLQFDVFPTVDALLEFARKCEPFIIAIDMPIGLPERIEGPGRGPEQAARQKLGPRKSSVFSIPSRSAVYANSYPEACAKAFATSDPPRKISKQAWHIFPKIIELDQTLICFARETGKGVPVFEVHPELAFATLSGGRPMSSPKKTKSKVNPDGMAERLAVLTKTGLDPHFLETEMPKGVSRDDFFDACACAAIAARLERGAAFPNPEGYECDPNGLPIAIWA